MSETTFEEFLASYSPEVQKLALQTRKLVLEVIPKVLEMVDPPSRIIAYGFSPKYADLVCAIAPYKSYINLIFSKGTELPDPDGLLTGTGKRARHVRINSSGDVKRPGLRSLIKTAADLTQT